MAENTDYKNFRKNVPKWGDRLDRVENLTGTGMPDINFCSNGHECWLEQKSPREPVRSTTPLFGSNHKLSVDQMNWFLRQRKAGGTAFILITTNKRWMLIGSDWADELNTMTVPALIFAAKWTAIKPIRDKKEWERLWNALQKN